MCCALCSDTVGCRHAWVSNLRCSRRRPRFFARPMGGGSSKSKARPSTAAVASPGTAAAKLGDVLKSAGVRKVILIRHANAQPRDPEAAAVEAGTVLKPDTPFANAWTVGDLTRKLTETGEGQAASAAAAFLDSLALKAVICSEATRAIATQEIMTHSSEYFARGGAGHLVRHLCNRTTSCPAAALPLPSRCPPVTLRAGASRHAGRAFPPHCLLLPDVNPGCSRSRVTPRQPCGAILPQVFMSPEVHNSGFIHEKNRLKAPE